MPTWHFFSVPRCQSCHGNITIDEALKTGTLHWNHISVCDQLCIIHHAHHEVESAYNPPAFPKSTILAPAKNALYRLFLFWRLSFQRRSSKYHSWSKIPSKMIAAGVDGFGEYLQKSNKVPSSQWLKRGKCLEITIGAVRQSDQRLHEKRDYQKREARRRKIFHQPSWFLSLSSHLSSSATSVPLTFYPGFYRAKRVDRIFTFASCVAAHESRNIPLGQDFFPPRDYSRGFLGGARREYGFPINFPQPQKGSSHDLKGTQWSWR